MKSNTNIKYFYKGNELYNVKYLKHDFNFHDIIANYKTRDGIEHLGKFYFKDLEAEKIEGGKEELEYDNSKEIIDMNL